MRSSEMLSNPASRSTSTARRTSSGPAARSSTRRSSGLNVCAPSETRLTPCRRRSCASSGVEHGEECLRRPLDCADLLHPLLAFLLLLDQLALARDVAAVALRDHVLPPRLDRLARDDPRADRSLDRDVEHLPRDLLAQLLDELPAAVVRELAVDDQRERVDRIAPDEDVDADERTGPKADVVVVEARVAAGARLERVVEVEHDLGERQLVGQVHPVLREGLHVVEAT